MHIIPFVTLWGEPFEILLCLGLLGDERPSAAVEVVHDGLALGLEAEPRLPLLVRANPVIRDKPAEIVCSNLFASLCAAFKSWLNSLLLTAICRHYGRHASAVYCIRANASAGT
jgi:hypothetical protein